MGVGGCSASVYSFVETKRQDPASPPAGFPLFHLETVNSFRIFIPVFVYWRLDYEGGWVGGRAGDRVWAGGSNRLPRAAAPPLPPWVAWSLAWTPGSWEAPPECLTGPDDGPGLGSCAPGPRLPAHPPPPSRPLPPRPLPGPVQAPAPGGPHPCESFPRIVRDASRSPPRCSPSLPPRGLSSAGHLPHPFLSQLFNPPLGNTFISFPQTQRSGSGLSVSANTRRDPGGSPWGVGAAEGSSAGSAWSPPTQRLRSSGCAPRCPQPQALTKKCKDPCPPAGKRRHICPPCTDTSPASSRSEAPTPPQGWTPAHNAQGGNQTLEAPRGEDHTCDTCRGSGGWAGAGGDGWRPGFLSRC
ncbi:basic salivary proline-rich protein 2-like [Canis lupus dingo]|uniref:basic salivary proline-rich protein 2-like n=1 Tax=Canis lupus dingo TaxID=286419 RepID=UPI000DC67A7A|nr:basic salivary proline-rich protein 2-like [Canis lupus dingo]XP_025312434.3 basic salivary proline-rich protein 2-like [Canis lupus dingo]